MKKFNKKVLATISAGFLMGTTLAACGPKVEPLSEGMQSTIDFINDFIQDLDGKTLASDKDNLVHIYTGEDAVYTVDWKISGTTAEYAKITGEEALQTLDINEECDIDVTFTLSAEVTCNGEKATTKTATIKLQKLAIATYAQYYEKCWGVNKDADGGLLYVEGIVTGVIGKTKGNSYNCLYLQDVNGAGGYYGYNLTRDPSNPETEVKIGQKVRISGTATNHDCAELKGGDYKILDATINPVQPVNMTEAFNAAASTADSAFVGKEGLYVQIDNVVVGAPGSNGYYYFKHQDSTKIQDAYLRISSSTCAMSTDAQAAFISAYTSKLNHTATIKGVISVYNGKFMIYPVDEIPVEYGSLVELSDAQQVAFEKDSLSINLDVSKAGQVDLPSAGEAYTGVAITWASNDDSAVISGSKVTYTLPAETKTIKLTATLTKGEATDTKEFDVKLIADNSCIAKALEAGAALAHDTTTEDSYWAIGTVKEITSAYSEQYKNVSFTLTDGTMDIIVFRYNLEDAATIAVGDLVAVAAPVKKYNADIELVAPFIAPETPYMSISEALELCVADNTTPAKLYGYVKSITSAYSAQYNNITIVLTDGTNDIDCYRLAGGDGLKAGDWIAVEGMPTAYNTSKQMNSGATYEVISKYVAPAKPFEAEHEGTQADPYSIADALGLGAELTKTTSKKDDGSGVYVSTYGTVVDGYFKGYIVKPGTYLAAGSGQPAAQKQFYLADSKDAESKDQLQVYIANFAGEIVEVCQNDLVVVKGVLMNYNGTIEISNKDTYKDGEKGKEVDSSYVPSIESRTVGTSTVTVEGATNATVTGLEASYTNGTKASFTVTPAEGYTIVSVKANNEVLVADQGTYSFDVKGDTTVTLELQSASHSETVVAKYSFLAEEGKTSATSYSEAADLGARLVKESGENIITGCKDLVKVYIGANGGSDPNKYYEGNVFKLGTSSANGSITLTLDTTKEFNAIRIVGEGWKNTNTITVGGVEKAFTTLINKDNLTNPDTLVFNVASGNAELSIASGGSTSIVIWSIEFLMIEE